MIISSRDGRKTGGCRQYGTSSWWKKIHYTGRILSMIPKNITNNDQQLQDLTRSNTNYGRYHHRGQDQDTARNNQLGGG